MTRIYEVTLNTAEGPLFVAGIEVRPDRCVRWDDGSGRGMEWIDRASAAEVLARWRREARSEDLAGLARVTRTEVL